MAKSYGVPVANVDYLAAVFMVAPLIFCASSRSVCPLSPGSASLPRLCNDQGPLSDPRSFGLRTDFPAMYLTDRYGVSAWARVGPAQIRQLVSSLTAWRV